MDLVEELLAQNKTDKDIRGTLKGLGYSTSRISQLMKKKASKSTSMEAPRGKDVASKIKKTKKATKEANSNQ